MVAMVPFALRQPSLGGTMKKLIAALVGVAFFAAGCNTIAGIGEDTQQAGKKLETSAEKNKPYRP
jgi:entericidin B